MKRSEMLDHIKEELLEKLKHRWLKMDDDLWADHTSNQLLDMIEGFDMLPPRTKLKGLELEDNAWEPEDET